MDALGAKGWGLLQMGHITHGELRVCSRVGGGGGEQHCSGFIFKGHSVSSVKRE